MTTLRRALSRLDRSRRSAVVSLLLVPLALGCATLHDHAAEADRLGTVMNLQPGMQVADVGAGDGEWSLDLAHRVGESGHVFATEVQEDDVEDLQERFEREGLENVTTLLGDQEGTGLEENCCDAILLRLVYHHFTEPAKMRADLGAALRPGGVLVVVEITPQSSWGQLSGVPERGGHGIGPEALASEMGEDGWAVVERHDDWGHEDDHYCIVFQKPTAGTGR